MAKGKNNFDVETSDNSDDDDGVSICSGLKVKEKTNKIFISATDSLSRKSKAKASSAKKKQAENKVDNGTSTESEVEYKSNFKTSKYLLEDMSTKKSKVKKRKREEVSSDSDLSGKDTADGGSRSVDKHLSDKPRKKPKRKNKGKIFDSHDPPENDIFTFKKPSKKNNITNNRIDSTSDNESVGLVQSQYNLEDSPTYVSLRDIKRELLSDALDSEAELVEDKNNNSASINTVRNTSAIKNEQQSFSSDSKDESDTNSESLPKRSTTEHSVTILQHIRLTPKNKTIDERLKDHFRDLRRKDITADFELSDSEEVSILRMPRNVNLKLKNVEIDPERRCKLNLGEKYVMTPTTNVPDPNYIVSTNCRVITFKNNIKMEKYFKSKSEPNIMIPEKKSVPLPENLKKRHPLFGSDFKQKIRLNDHVEKKLDDAIANLLKRNKSRKKKNKKSNHAEKEDDDNQEIFNLLNSHSFLASNERIKKETSDDSAIGSSSSTDKPKGKKKQKSHTSDKYVKQEIELSLLNDSTEEIFKTPKKKKSKIASGNDFDDISNIKQEIREADSVDSKERAVLSKADKKRLLMINSTLMSDILKTPKFDPEVSTITSDASTSGRKHKKSKKDRKSNDGIKIKKEKLISELLNDITMEIKTSKKIKKET